MQVNDYEAETTLREAAAQFAGVIHTLCPNTNRRTIALGRLTQALVFAIQASREWPEQRVFARKQVDTVDT